MYKGKFNKYNSLIQVKSITCKCYIQNHILKRVNPLVARHLGIPLIFPLLFISLKTWSTVMPSFLDLLIIFLVPFFPLTFYIVDLLFLSTPISYCIKTGLTDFPFPRFSQSTIAIILLQSSEITNFFV